MMGGERQRYIDCPSSTFWKDPEHARPFFSKLKSLGFAKENIRKYGFAFEGKKVLIGRAVNQPKLKWKEGF